jgi:cellulose synthase/poly-beta-1,6-N-acetylglucosamine synthase-like glycosyltransferase
MLLIVITLRAMAAVYAFCRCVSTPRQSGYMLRDDDLPRYTVLVALYQEARILPQLVKALTAIEYPTAKLDIKLILEAVDQETIARARMMDLPPQFEILIVPDGAPRTKPRALNYALQFARGELLVVYDAEDRPDPQQLRMAATHFASAPEDVVCLQAQLTIENFSHNWLAKQFTIEYASLFGGILPLLDRARIPIPLGGTSNHFRIGTLRKLGAWDAYNVTEDADLGMRIYRAGFRAEVLFSETLEEAACQPGNWLRQRTRWLKGWMQTYQVHMRQPWRLMRELGPMGFFAFQGHFAGVILAALIYPASYILIAYDATTGQFLSQPHSILDYHLLTITVFNLVAGFTGSFVLALFALKRRHLLALLPQIPLIPVYWFFISVAAYRALYQFLTAPHYWEKTEHFGSATADAGDEPASVKRFNNPQRGMLAPVMQSRNRAER